MAWYHVNGCDCPEGCCDCGTPMEPSQPKELVMIYYDQVADEIKYEVHDDKKRGGWASYFLREGNKIPFLKNCIFLGNDIFLKEVKMKRIVHLSNGETTEWNDEIETLDQLKSMIGRIGLTVVKVEEPETDSTPKHP